jgi:hypothetical protein
VQWAKANVVAVGRARRRTRGPVTGGTDEKVRSPSGLPRSPVTGDVPCQRAQPPRAPAVMASSAVLMFLRRVSGAAHELLQKSMRLLWAKIHTSRVVVTQGCVGHRYTLLRWRARLSRFAWDLPRGPVMGRLALAEGRVDLHHLRECSTTMPAMFSYTCFPARWVDAGQFLQWHELDMPLARGCSKPGLLVSSGVLRSLEGAGGPLTTRRPQLGHTARARHGMTNGSQSADRPGDVNGG